jgi:hypothetical protein
MLNATQEAALLSALSLINQGDAKAAQQLINQVLLDNSKHKLSVSAAAQARAAAGQGGRQAMIYAIETEPGGVELAKGAAAAHAALAAELARLDDKRTLPKVNSFAVLLSRNGFWAGQVDTFNGTVSVTVRKATEDELARLLQ